MLARTKQKFTSIHDILKLSYYLPHCLLKKTLIADCKRLMRKVVDLLLILFKKQAHICTRKGNEVLTKDKSETPFKNHKNF